MKISRFLPAVFLLALAAPALQAASSIGPNRGTTAVVVDTGRGTHVPLMTCATVAPDGTVTNVACGGAGGGGGDATAANQATGNASLASIDGKTPALVSGRQPVDGSGVTQPISAAALPLPSGAATAANQTTSNTTLSAISGQLPATLGQKASTASQAVVIASDQSAVAVSSAPVATAANGLSPVVTSAVASSLVIKASAGNLYSINVVSGATAGFLLVFNATSAPADGAVTPVKCMPVAANTGVEINYRSMPVAFGTGITAVFSSTGCFLKTASATAFISGDAK